MRRVRLFLTCLLVGLLGGQTAAEARGAPGPGEPWRPTPPVGAVAYSVREGPEALLRLTRDPDPFLRAQAVRALRAGPLLDEVVARLEALARDSAERDLVRIEAAKALALASHGVLLRTLVPLAGDESAGVALRAAALRALYDGAGRYPRVRAAVVRRLEERTERPELRRAAAWALFTATWDGHVPQVLLRHALDRWADRGLRFEALRSLFLATAYPEVREGVMALARDRGVDAGLRSVAVLVLQGARSHPDAWALLERLATDREEHAAVRAAALEARQPFLSEARVRFFHLSRYADHVRDPLD